MTFIGTQNNVELVERGKVSGEKLVAKFGRHPSLSTTVHDIWDGASVYNWLASAQTLKVSSSDVNDTGSVLSSGTATGGSLTTLVDSGATFSSDGVAADDVVLNDTGLAVGVVVTVDSETQITVDLFRQNDRDILGYAFAAGHSYRVVNANSTGAAVVKLYGLDANWNEQSEFVVLNGQTSVNTANTYLRLYSSYIINCGSSGFNEGNVFFYTGTQSSGVPTTATQIYGKIIAEAGQTLMAIYTIPAGYCGFMVRLFASSGASKEVSLTLHSRVYGHGARIRDTIGMKDSSYIRDNMVGRAFGPKTDIWLCGTASATTPVSAGFVIHLVNTL